MASVRELSDLYANFFIPLRHGDGVCEVCFNLTSGYRRCFACTRTELWLDCVLPISYSVGGEQLHHVLASYKRLDGKAAVRLRAGIAAVLWRYLDRHEPCAAVATGVEGFQVITSIPSGKQLVHGRPGRPHPLQEVVGHLVGPTRGRYHPLLVRTDLELGPREFHSDRFRATEGLSGQSVLVIDDTWTTGATAQSAAAALKEAGAGRIAAVVVGRHVNRSWGENDRRLQAVEGTFTYESCALCAHAAPADELAATGKP